MNKNTIATIILSFAVLALFAVNVRLLERVARLEARTDPEGVALGPIDSPDEPPDSEQPQPITPLKMDDPGRSGDELAPIPVRTAKAGFVGDVPRVAPAAESSRGAGFARTSVSAATAMSQDEKRKLDEDIAKMRALFDTQMAEIEARRKDAPAVTGSGVRQRANR